MSSHRLILATLLITMLVGMGTLLADAYDDYRAANMDVYGITAGTSSPVVFPGEFEQSQMLVLAWSGSFPDVTAQIIYALNPVVDIMVLHYGTAELQDFQNHMAAYGVGIAGIQYINTELDSIWVGDFGPMPILHPGGGELAFVDPRYFHQRVFDDAVPHVLAESLGVIDFRMPLDAEARSVLSDGRGTCFATTHLLTHNGIPETLIREYLRDYLGCAKTIFLAPLDGEGTGQPGLFLKVLDGERLIVGEYTPGQDATNQVILDNNAALLSSETAADGSQFNVIRMPMPGNSDDNYRTYVDSVMVNGVNLIPIYTNDNTLEAQALAIWQSELPGWTHVPLDNTVLITWAGTIRNIVAPIPAGTLAAYQPPPSQLCANVGCYPTETGGNAGCGAVPVAGLCAGDNASYCNYGTVVTPAGCGLGSPCIWWPDSGHYGCGACVPDCTGLDCGDDGCGSSCGTCGADETCSPAGQCEPTLTECELLGISYEGCCEGLTAKYCDGDTVAEIQCPDTCGWDPDHGWYDCGFGGADPSGQFPLACQCAPDCTDLACGDDGCGGSCGTCQPDETCDLSGQCVPDCIPDCTDSECGDDGCGGSCGSCPAGETCDANDQCVACTPNCAGRDCGDDGCGGSCGGCGADETCSATGQCELNSDQCEQQGITYEGCCDGLALKYCDGDAVVEIQCPSSCGWDNDHGWYYCGFSGADPSGAFPLSCPCTPDCTDRECGDDGCGGSCGTCQAGESCDTDGLCVPDCIPECTDRECGDDGCEGSCGTCGAGESCDSDGLCVPDCVPACTDRECGDDGCGGSCGTCGAGESCDSDGLCVPACTPNCTDSECGDDGCGGSCGTCGAGESCDSDGLCVPDCTPECTDRVCGDDGCGGSCGSCPEGELCAEDGSCVQEKDPGGCGCGSSKHNPDAAGLALLGLVLFAWRRRI